MTKFEENADLWALNIPGRDERETELDMVNDDLKKVLSPDALNKFMHAGVLAYASTCYMLDVMEELSYLEDKEKADKLQTLCLQRICTDLKFGLEGSRSSDENLERLIDWSVYVFEEAEKKI